MYTKEASIKGGKARGEKISQQAIENYESNPNYCNFCHKKIELNGRAPAVIRAKKYCNHSCAASFSNVSRKKPKLVKPKITDKTKGYLFSTKGYFNARSIICRHAVRVFNKSKSPKECVICGYSTHIEVCHIKSVSSFDDNTPVSVINDISNLVPMCRNHHWEYDNDLIPEERIELSTASV